MMWSILSNNCWGGGLYREMGLAYNTPTIGLWFAPDDYLSFLQDLRANLEKPLLFERDEPNSHPVGVLGDVKIQFLHYQNKAEAFSKWILRAQRLPKNDDDLYVKICDRDGFSEQHLPMFDALPFRRKIAFLKRGRFNISKYPWAVEVESDQDTVPDGIQLWRITGGHFRSWLLSSELHRQASNL